MLFAVSPKVSTRRRASPGPACGGSDSATRHSRRSLRMTRKSVKPGHALTKLAAILARVKPQRPLLIALAMAVGLVLADGSVVVLALPEIYRDFDVSVTAVTWVLVAFNLVLAAAAVPAVRAAACPGLAAAAVPATLAARRLGPARATAVGLTVFAGGSLACALS